MDDVIPGINNNILRYCVIPFLLNRTKYRMKRVCQFFEREFRDITIDKIPYSVIYRSGKIHTDEYYAEWWELLSNNPNYNHPEIDGDYFLECWWIGRDGNYMSIFPDSRTVKK